MARKRTRALRAASPPVAEDFKRIRGLGPSTEKHLRNAGIWTFVQLAKLSPGAIASLVPNLSAKQVIQKNWIGQARKLASSKGKSKTRKKKPVILTGRQHYDNFTLEFLLDEKNNTRRILVVHVQSGDTDTWAGWEAERLIGFLSRHTGMRLLATKTVPQEIARPRGKASLRTTTSSIASERPAKSPSRSSLETEFPLPASNMVEHTPAPASTAQFAGVLHLRDLKVIAFDSDIPGNVLSQGQPYLLRLTLDLTGVIAPRDAPLVYRASIIAKQPGGQRQLVGKEHDTFVLSESVTLNLAGISLPRGVYRLSARVRLASTGKGFWHQPGIIASLEGDLLEVY